jgi:macrodomain Ter protein organizer (MatP/YcbG family)
VGQDFSNNSNAQHTQNTGNKPNIDENILKLIDTLYSFAKTNNKIEELKTDLSILLSKYM